MITNKAKINSLNDPNHQVLPVFHEIVLLLDIFVEIATKLERACVPLSFAHPLLCDGIEKFDKGAAMDLDSAIKIVHARASASMRL
jgi:hypothetical protein